MAQPMAPVVRPGPTTLPPLVNCTDPGRLQGCEIHPVGAPSGFALATSVFGAESRTAASTGGSLPVSASACGSVVASLGVPSRELSRALSQATVASHAASSAASALTSDPPPSEPGPTPEGFSLVHATTNGPNTSPHTRVFIAAHIFPL